MNRILLTSALALTLAGPALASDQLARSLGVEPGVYSTSELIALRSAVEDDNFAQANAIRAGGNDGFTASTKSVTSSSAQLAASVGVEPGVYSNAQLIALRSAIENDDFAQANAIRNSVGEGFSASTKSGVSAGTAQLAASLGVDAADYSRAELVRLKSVQSSDNGRGE